MNDETKDELMRRTREWLQSCVNAATRSGVPEEADLEAFILAHLDGEPARLAAAREEQREACALDAEERVGCASTYDEIRSVPLDATPLADELRTLRADELRALRARVAELEVDVQVETGLAADLRVRVAELEAHLGGMTEQWKAELNHANAWMRKFRAAEAQVAAARAVCERLIDRPWSRWAGDAGRDVLRAMDEATKK